MSLDEQKVRRESPIILFPEIIGVSLVALLAPAYLVRILLSGQMTAGIAGLALWFIALFFTVRFIWRRQYIFAYLPMIAMLGLYYVIQKWMIL